jgi:hypothetical protein
MIKPRIKSVCFVLKNVKHMNTDITSNETKTARIINNNATMFENRLMRFRNKRISMIRGANMNPI